jgi:hypothetical protein
VSGPAGRDPLSGPEDQLGIRSGSLTTQGGAPADAGRPVHPTHATRQPRGPVRRGPPRLRTSPPTTPAFQLAHLATPPIPSPGAGRPITRHASAPGLRSHAPHHECHRRLRPPVPHATPPPARRTQLASTPPMHLVYGHPLPLRARPDYSGLPAGPPRQATDFTVAERRRPIADAAIALALGPARHVGPDFSPGLVGAGRARAALHAAVTAAGAQGSRGSIPRGRRSLRRRQVRALPTKTHVRSHDDWTSHAMDPVPRGGGDTAAVHAAVDASQCRSPSPTAGPADVLDAVEAGAIRAIIGSSPRAVALADTGRHQGAVSRRHRKIGVFPPIPSDATFRRADRRSASGRAAGARESVFHVKQAPADGGEERASPAWDDSPAGPPERLT